MTTYTVEAIQAMSDDAFDALLDSSDDSDPLTVVREDGKGVVFISVEAYRELRNIGNAIRSQPLPPS